MRILFLTICVVVVYRTILDNLQIRDPTATLTVATFRYIGNIALIMVLCISIRDTVKSA